MRRVLLALVLLGMIACWPAVALAQAQPDTIRIDDVEAYRDLIEAGDLLVVTYYTIDYQTVPATKSDDLFVYSLENSGSPIATSAPFPYFDSDGDGTLDGYGEGLVSVYLTASQTADEGLTSAGVWNAWPVTTLGVQLEGNPIKFTTVPGDGEILTSDDYSSSSGEAANRTQLGSFILNAARDLQAFHGTTLLVQGADLLNLTGQDYVNLAIPNFARMAPQILATRTETPNFPTPSGDDLGTFAQNAEDRAFQYPSWGQSFQELGDALNVPARAVSGVFVLFLAGWLIQYGLKEWGQRGAVAMLVFSSVFLLPYFMIVGWIAWAAGAVTIFALILAAAVKRSRDFHA